MISRTPNENQLLPWLIFTFLSVFVVDYLFLLRRPDTFFFDTLSTLSLVWHLISALLETLRCFLVIFRTFCDFFALFLLLFLDFLLLFLYFSQFFFIFSNFLLKFPVFFFQFLSIFSQIFLQLSTKFIKISTNFHRKYQICLNVSENNYPCAITDTNSLRLRREGNEMWKIL